MRLVAHLQRGAQDLPHDIAERLRVARERALAGAPVRAAATAPAAGAVSVGPGLRALRGGPSLWWRFASALPLLVLAAGLVMIERHSVREQLDAAAQIDAQLLGDELPPQAYRDPGFVEFARLLEGT